MSDQPKAAKVNTDIHLWPPGPSIDRDAYAPRMFAAAEGGIGMCVGGRVHVLKIEEWHKMIAEVDVLHSEYAKKCEETVEQGRQLGSWKTQAERYHRSWEEERARRRDVEKDLAELRQRVVSKDIIDLVEAPKPKNPDKYGIIAAMAEQTAIADQRRTLELYQARVLFGFWFGVVACVVGSIAGIVAYVIATNGGK